MHITGIVVEYNPFHNGHLYQLIETKKLTGCDKIVVVMSGNFSQRGTPCITDKYTRAQMALLSGVDMVLELPVPFATASAERFSEAAISIFNKSGIINNLCFGSEVDDIHLMHQIATTLTHEPHELSLAIQENLKSGMSFPTSREYALTHYLNLKENLNLTTLQTVLNNPNNILGIEYIKALIKYQSNIKPFTLKRKTAAYHDTTIHSSIASASAIREDFKKHHARNIIKAMPSSCVDLLLDSTQEITSLDDFSSILHHQLIFSTLEDLYSLWDVPKNLCHSLSKAYTSHFNTSDIIDEITSKTYSRSTASRSILRLLLNIQQTDLDRLEQIDWIPYIRVLGCKKDSLSILSHLTKQASVPVITNLGKIYNNLSPLAKILIDYEVQATNLYYLGKKQPHQYGQDFSRSFMIVD